MTSIKAYTHRESSHSFLPNAALTALDQPRHVRQGSLYVFEYSKAAAAMTLANLGIRVNTRDLKVATGFDVAALTEAKMATAGAVYAMSTQGRDIVALHPSPDARGEAVLVTCVGQVTRGGPGPRRFIPANAVAASEITDTMVDAARRVLDPLPDSTTLAEIGDDTIRTAIAAALAAQPEETPR